MTESCCQRLEKLRQFVKDKLGDAPGCHDFGHTSRVVHNALLLAGMESLTDADSLTVIEVSALLHDIARPDELAASGSLCHAEYGATLVPDILRQFDYTEDGFIETVASAVLRHRFRGRIRPETPEERVVFDADKLDSVGAIGIGRAFHFAGRIGARVHNRDEEALSAEAYSREDSAYREYLVKLRKIPERMMTESGRLIAARRVAFMDGFFETMNREVYGVSFD